ncbi:MAG: ABC transporter permease [candidate division Zixibacteria bacterium]|nr:ABC transporter permease [candidate division Zixibacteria bacterium]
MRRQRILALVKKEFITVRRDFSFALNIFILPLIMLVIYGYGIRFDIQYLPTVVWDLSQTPQSRDLVEKFFASGYFRAAGMVDGYGQIEERFDKGKAKLALVFPTEFGSRLARGEKTAVQILVDGSDNNTATLAVGYASGIVRGYQADLVVGKLVQKGIRLPFETPVLTEESRMWYNPELKSVNFIVPGIIVVIMSMMGTVMTAMAIVGEKERGTFEQVAASPLSGMEFLVGKIAPYILLALVDMILIVAAGYLLFQVPIKGSFALLFLFALLFVSVTTGLGLWVSSVSDSLQGAMTLAFLVTLLPSILLSGFIFPIENFPAALKALTYLNPGRYFIEALRGIYLKGVGISVLWPQAAFLSLLGASLLGLTLLRFKKRLA